MGKIKYLFKAMALGLEIKSRKSLIVSIIALPAAFLPMLISLQLESFTNEVSSLYQNPDTLKFVILSFGALAVFYILQTAFTNLQNYYLAEDSVSIIRYLKEKVLDLSTKVPYKYIENDGAFREKLDFIKDYAGTQTAGSISLIFTWIFGVISFTSVAYVLAGVSYWIVIVLIATCIPAVILSLLQKEETYTKRTKWMKSGRATLVINKNCSENLAMKEIRFFGLYPYLRDKFRSLSKDYVRQKNEIAKKHVIYNGIADVLRNGVYLIVVAIAAWEIYKNPSMGLGSFMLVITASGQLQTITTNLLISAVSIFADMSYIKDFFDIMAMEKEEVSDEVPFENVDIEFTDVSFTYPGGEKKALDALSIKIKQGEKIAIVGANGSGKSTFVNLVCGLYEADNGKVSINNEAISKNLSKTRNSLSVIFQHFCQYQDTLRNNIAISDPARVNDDEDMLKIAKATGASEIFDMEGDGLDEMIGVFSDYGRNLSGGQWQKLAITRALFRKDARVYILDEPTAALDPVAEANIYRNFAQLTEDKTTILISHRLAISSLVDRILVFDNGKIVEDGNHDQLIARKWFTLQ